MAAPALLAIPSSVERAALSPVAARAAASATTRAPAEEFEALLLTQLLKGMRRTVPESGEHSAARDLYHELHDEMLASHLAKHGGLGLAAMIRTYLGTAAAAKPEAGKS